MQREKEINNKVYQLPESQELTKCFPDISGEFNSNVFGDSSGFQSCLCVTLMNLGKSFGSSHGCRETEITI